MVAGVDVVVAADLGLSLLSLLLFFYYSVVVKTIAALPSRIQLVRLISIPQKPPCS